MEARECSRCLLKEGIPGVSLSGRDGLCSVCEDYDKTWGSWTEKRQELEDLFERARRKKRDYDVLVPLSGGKDSTYVLYLCRKVFGLKCLAITFDNGFLSDCARRNIQKACDTLAVDHIFYQFNKAFLFDLYRECFLKTGFLCSVCMQAMTTAIGSIQATFRIPLSVSGTSRRTEEHTASEFFVLDDLSFLENIFAESRPELDKHALLRPLGVFFSPPRIRLPDYLRWNYQEIFRTITTELDWRSHDMEAEHSDCKVHPVVHYVRGRRFPQLTPDLLRFSKLVTCGQMTKEEARLRVQKAAQAEECPGELNWFLQTLGISQDEFDGVLQSPLVHMKYVQSNSAVKRRLRTLRHRLLPW